MRIWYDRRYIWATILLLPFAFIFKWIVALRTFLYRIQVKKTIHFPVPIIVVGNITVGGTGKTPLVIWMVNFLKEQGLRPGVVSRGYGGKKQHQPCWVTSQSDPHEVGDEAILIAKRADAPLVVAVDRVAAVRELLAKTNCNVVITDDGLQHYRLGRDIEIAVIDGERGLGNRHFLPAGPLRESQQRLKKVDFVVYHSEAKPGVLTMQLIPHHLAAVSSENKNTVLEQLKNTTVHAVAGIGNPERFFSLLRKQGLQIIKHVFPDHHLYCAADFHFNDSLPIVMTEKDAVKCKHFADERFWYLPVEVKIDKVFQVALMAKLTDLGAYNHAT